MKYIFSRINIIKQSEEELVLRINPILSYVFMLGFIILALLLLLFNMTTTYSTNLSCQKLSETSEKISCQLSSTNLLRIGSEQTLALSNMAQAVIIKKYNKEIDTNEYLVTLKKDEEEIILTRNPIDYHYDEWQDKIIKLNNFLKSNKTLKSTINDKNGDIVLAGFSLDLLLIIIVAIIWASKTVVNCSISLKTGMLFIERQKLFNKKVNNYLLKDINKAFLETRGGIDKNTSRIVFKSNTGELIPMMSYYDSFSGKEEAVLYINRFLK